MPTSDGPDYVQGFFLSLVGLIVGIAIWLVVLLVQGIKESNMLEERCREVGGRANMIYRSPKLCMLPSGHFIDVSGDDYKVQADGWKN
jgi:hypothetical protein